MTRFLTYYCLDCNVIEIGVLFMPIILLMLITKVTKRILHEFITIFVMGRSMKHMLRIRMTGKSVQPKARHAVLSGGNIIVCEITFASS